MNNWGTLGWVGGWVSVAIAACVGGQPHTECVLAGPGPCSHHPTTAHSFVRVWRLVACEIKRHHWEALRTTGIPVQVTQAPLPPFGGPSGPRIVPLSHDLRATSAPMWGPRDGRGSHFDSSPLFGGLETARVM